MKNYSIDRTDFLSVEERSARMKLIKSTSTKDEVRLGKALWSLGYRYRKNNKSIYGKPDFTFKKLKIAIFIDSEFFHGYNWENYKHRIKSNKEFWYKKIERNIQRDKEVTAYLNSQNWIVIRIWSKELRKNFDFYIKQISEKITDQLTTLLPEQ